MTQTNPDFAATKAAAAIPAELLGAATRKIADVLEVHKDLLETFEAINHEFFCRAKTEADLASDFVEQFGSVRSIQTLPRFIGTGQQSGWNCWRPTAGSCSSMARKSRVRAGDCSRTVATGRETIKIPALVLCSRMPMP